MQVRGTSLNHGANFLIRKVMTDQQTTIGRTAKVSQGAQETQGKQEAIAQLSKDVQVQDTSNDILQQQASQHLAQENGVGRTLDLSV